MKFLVVLHASDQYHFRDLICQCSKLMVGSVSLVIFYHHYVLEIGVAVVAAVVQAPAVVDYDKIAIVYCKQTADFK